MKITAIPDWLYRMLFIILVMVKIRVPPEFWNQVVGGLGHGTGTTRLGHHLVSVLG